MPIYKSFDNITLHFGHGDIAIWVAKTTTRTEGYDSISFNQCPSGEIGRDATDQDLRHANKVGSPAVMVFDTVESLDVVIERLGSLRKSMTKQIEATS